MNELQLTTLLDALQHTTARLIKQHEALDKRFCRLQAAHADAQGRILVLEQFTLNNYIEKEGNENDHISNN